MNTVLTAKHLNERYNEFIGDGHYGIDVHGSEQLEYIDSIFSKYTNNEDFRIYQVEYKFGCARVYTSGVPKDVVEEMEDKLTNMLNGLVNMN